MTARLTPSPRPLAKPFAATLVVATLACCAAPAPAGAASLTKPICTLAGLVSTLAGKICDAASHAGRIVSAGGKLLSGKTGGAIDTILGSGGSVAKSAVAVGALAAAALWVTDGAREALRLVQGAISDTTTPALESTWFSAFYWQMAGIAILLTLPFLFAAAIQALMRSDLSLLARSAFGYLPLGMIGVGIAAPLTMLLLAGSDEMAQIVSSASGNADATFLAKAGVETGLLTYLSHSPFLGFFVGVGTVAAVVTLWAELLIRSAAVYVIVLMLPLFFAALVWPARRAWAGRAVELLVALILSKFAIVAVLALGGAAFGHTTIPSVGEALAGATLILLAAFSPWALLRILPLHELAAGAVGGLRTRGMLSANADLASDLHDAREAAKQRDEVDEPAVVGELSPPGRELLGRLGRGRPLDEPVEVLDAEAAEPAHTEAAQPAHAQPAEPAHGEPASSADAEAVVHPEARSAAPGDAEPDAPPPKGLLEAPKPREPTRAERRETLDPMFRSGDFSWRTLELGPDDGLGPVYEDPAEEPDPLPPFQGRDEATL